MGNKYNLITNSLSLPKHTFFHASHSFDLQPYKPFNNSQCLSRTETLRRVPTSSRHDALNATLSVRVRETRSAQTCTVCSDARLVPLMASHTPMPTRQRELHGITTPCSSTLRTQRSTFQERRWHSVDWRRTRTGTI